MQFVKLSKPSASYIQKSLRGAPKVVATCDTKKGLTGNVVPKDTVGYVVASHNGDDYKHVLVFWMHSNDASSHAIRDLTFVGEQFTSWSKASEEVRG